MINPMLSSVLNASNLLAQFQSFKQNPTQFMLQRNIPQGALQDPAGTIQNLLNSGQMSQAQFNQLQQMAVQLRNNPMFAPLLSNKN